MASSDSRVSSEHGDDHPSPPARLSALYQYHNAPEVAPAHGLEYDDTIYPVSDKFPVIKETIFNKIHHHHHHYTGKHAYDNDNKPPRIIFGMKVKTFLVVALVMVLVIVGAAVGGAVGGKNLHQGPGPDMTYANSPDTQSSSTAISSPTHTAAKPTKTTAYVAPTPTFTPLSDCPASNGTTYKSQYADGSQGAVPDGTGLTFTKYCDVVSPLSASNAVRISEAYVYSFSDCVEVCAGYNYLHGGINCTFAVYQPKAKRPSNCEIGSADGVNASTQPEADSIDVAMIELIAS